MRSHRLAQLYRAAYFGPLRCASVVRMDRYLYFSPSFTPIVCEPHQFLYYPIPKTGCTTIKSLILDSTSRAVPDDDEDIHAVIEDTPPMLPPERYFQFAFVRNPWSRLVSCYQNKVLEKRPGIFDGFAYLYPHIRFNTMSFNDFASFACRVPDDLCEPHFKPQSHFFNVEQVDFIGRFEKFSDDLAQVIRHLGLDEQLCKWGKTQRMKSASNQCYTDFYNTKTQRLVAKKYAQDIEQLGYRFGA